IAYAQGKAKSLNGYGDQDYSKYVDLSLNYAINNHFTTYVDYKINLLDNNEYTRQNSVLTDDVVAVAFQYNF
ncbi:MAG: porin, partial [Plesiomonas shigelloides]